jgi:hypothetical protein
MSTKKSNVIDLTGDSDEDKLSLGEIGARLEKIPFEINSHAQPPQYNTLLDFCSTLERLPVFDPLIGITSNYDYHNASRRKRRRKSEIDSSLKSSEQECV